MSQFWLWGQAADYDRRMVTELPELKNVGFRETRQGMFYEFKSESRQKPSLAASCYGNDGIPSSRLVAGSSGLKKNVPAWAHAFHTNVLYTVHFARASKGYVFPMNLESAPQGAQVQNPTHVPAVVS